MSTAIASRVAALERAILDGEGEEAAAIAVGEAVRDGASAQGFVERIVAAMDTTFATAARSELAYAVTLDLIRRGDITVWMAHRTWARRAAFDAALVRADTAGCDVRAAVLALAEPEHIEAAAPAIRLWCQRARPRVADVVANLALDSVATFANEVREALAEVVPRLAEVLSASRDAAQRARAVQLLRVAAQQHCELGAARDALRVALDCDENPARDAAWALTLVGEAGLDRDPRAAVRMGAWHARPSFLGLLDPEPYNRRRIAAALLEQIAANAELSPSHDEIQCLLAELLDPVVAEVVYAVIDRGEVAGVIAEVESHGAARHLVAAARAVLARAPAPVCRTCRDIPRHSYGRNFSPPPATQEGLAPAFDLSQEGERDVRCIECGTTYRVSSRDITDVLGPEYEATIERLPADDPPEVARWRDRLDHPELWVRRDAAWIVARAAAAAGDTATLDELVAHRDVDVRREAWQVMPVAAMWRALDDVDDSIRSNAALHLASGDDPAVLVRLLDRDPVVAGRTAWRMSWSKPYPPEVVQALRARMLAARGRSNLDEALGGVCHALGRALEKTPDPAIVAEAIDIAIHAPPAIQVCMLQVLLGAGPTADTSALDDTLVELLRNPVTRSEAINLLGVRATTSRPPRIDHLEALATMLVPEYSSSQEAAIAILAHAARTPSTQAAGFAGLFALLDTGNATTAAGRVHELARELPLGDVARQLTEIVAKVSDGYVRQELVRALLVDARRRGDTASIATLVDHPHPGVARAARSYTA